MSDEPFLSGQRRGINLICALFVGLVTLMWVAAMLDYAFNLGWGWDRQILLLGPLMVMFALLLRFVALAILRLVGRNY